MAVISLNTTALPHFSQESTEGINTVQIFFKNHVVFNYWWIFQEVPINSQYYLQDTALHARAVEE